MFKFNGMPYKRSGRAGGKSVSMIGMLVLLLAALLVLPSCFDDDDDGVSLTCGEGTVLNEATDMCDPVPVDPVDLVTCGEGTMLNAATNMCDPVPVDPVTCADGTVMSGNTCVPDPTEEYDMVGELEEGECHEDGDRNGMVQGADAAECIDGQGGNDSIKGMGGNDDLKGGPGNDRLYGGDGDDKLDGGMGDDSLNGGAGNDELTGGSGDNVLDGGDGDEDIAIYKDAMRVVASLKDNRARAQHVTPDDIDPLVGEGDDGTGTDTLTNIENVKGSLLGNDIIDGNDNANVLKGLDGADTINGHDGDDTILPNRPAEVDEMGAAVANTAAGDDPAGTDGEDMVDGGDGSDTINYEGESSAVTVDLGTIVEATDPDDTPDSGDEVAAHFAASVNAIVDRIATVNIGTEDDPNVVSTVENATGGFGGDTLTGDARANTLMGGAENDTLNGEVDPATAEDGANDMLVGGAGDDTLNGGPGNDTLMGGAGDDTLNGHGGNDTLMGGAGDNNLDGGPGDDYYGVMRGDTGTVTEDAEEGDDSLRYIATADNDATTDVDESEMGVGTDTAGIDTPANVETVFGTPNDDYIEANDGGGAVLGREGDDDLDGGTGVDTLVGCAGENTLNGDEEDDVFGVLSGSTNEIEDFTTGADDATTDEIHLKGFEAGATATFAKIVDNVTHAAVQVNGVTVATVTSETGEIDAIDDVDTTMDVDESRTKVEAIIDALGKDGAVSFDHTFDPAKCSSN